MSELEKRHEGADNVSESSSSNNGSWWEILGGSPAHVRNFFNEKRKKTRKSPRNIATKNLQKSRRSLGLLQEYNNSKASGSGTSSFPSPFSPKPGTCSTPKTRFLTIEEQESWEDLRFHEEPTERHLMQDLEKAHAFIKRLQSSSSKTRTSSPRNHSIHASPKCAGTPKNKTPSKKRTLVDMPRLRYSDRPSNCSIPPNNELVCTPSKYRFLRQAPGEIARCTSLQPNSPVMVSIPRNAKTPRGKLESGAFRRSLIFNEEGSNQQLLPKDIIIKEESPLICSPYNGSEAGDDWNQRIEDIMSPISSNSELIELNVSSSSEPRFETGNNSPQMSSPVEERHSDQASSPRTTVLDEEDRILLSELGIYPLSREKSKSEGNLLDLDQRCTDPSQRSDNVEDLTPSTRRRSQDDILDKSIMTKISEDIIEMVREARQKKIDEQIDAENEKVSFGKTKIMKADDDRSEIENRSSPQKEFNSNINGTKSPKKAVNAYMKTVDDVKKAKNKKKQVTSQQTRTRKLYNKYQEESSLSNESNSSFNPHSSSSEAPVKSILSQSRRKSLGFEKCVQFSPVIQYRTIERRSPQLVVKIKNLGLITNLIAEELKRKSLGNSEDLLPKLASNSPSKDCLEKPSSSPNKGSPLKSMCSPNENSPPKFETSNRRTPSPPQRHITFRKRNLRSASKEIQKPENDAESSERPQLSPIFDSPTKNLRRISQSKPISPTFDSPPRKNIKSNTPRVSQRRKSTVVVDHQLSPTFDLPTESCQVSPVFEKPDTENVNLSPTFDVPEKPAQYSPIFDLPERSEKDVEVTEAKRPKRLQPNRLKVCLNYDDSSDKKENQRKPGKNIKKTENTSRKNVKNIGKNSKSQQKKNKPRLMSPIFGSPNKPKSMSKSLRKKVSLKLLTPVNDNRKRRVSFYHNNDDKMRIDLYEKEEVKYISDGRNTFKLVISESPLLVTILSTKEDRPELDLNLTVGQVINLYHLLGNLTTVICKSEHLHGRTLVFGSKDKYDIADKNILYDTDIAPMDADNENLLESIDNLTFETVSTMFECLWFLRPPWDKIGYIKLYPNGLKKLCRAKYLLVYRVLAGEVIFTVNKTDFKLSKDFQIKIQANDKYSFRNENSSNVILKIIKFH